MRRLEQFTAFLTAAAIVASPFGVTPCACAAVSASDSCCEATAAEASGCCSHGGEGPAGCCCSQTADPAVPASCACLSAAGEIPATVPTNSGPAVDSDNHWVAAPHMAAVNADLLNGVSLRLLDLEALGRLPGLRLHALLCVWRN